MADTKAVKVPVGKDEEPILSVPAPETVPRLLPAKTPKSRVEPEAIDVDQGGCLFKIV